MKILTKVLFCVVVVFGLSTSYAQPSSPSTQKVVQQPSSHVVSQAVLTHAIEYLAGKKEELLNDLDYFSSKGIDVELSVLGGRMTVHYKARWGYRGAGDATQPFKGFKGSFTIPVTLAKGLTVDPLQADRAKEAMHNLDLNRLINVSPTDEFRLKLFSLFASVGRDEISSDVFCKELKILLKRIALTPGFDGIEVSGWQLVGTDKRPGYLDSIANLPPEMFRVTNKWFSHVLRVLTPLLGLMRGRTDHQALKSLLANINYQENADLIIASNGEQLARVEFGYHGLGNTAAPLTGCVLTVDLPFAPAVSDIITRVQAKLAKFTIPNKVIVPVGPATEALLKTLMLFASVHNGTFPVHRIASEAEALLHRLLITPNVGDIRIGIGSLSIPLVGTPQQPGLLRILAFKAQEIMKRDFSVRETTPLAVSDALTLLLSIMYKAGADYANTRIQIRSHLAQTDEGKKLLGELSLAMHNLEQTRTPHTKQQFDTAMAGYRKLELTTGKKEFEQIASFVLQELGHLVKRLGSLHRLDHLVKKLEIVKEFEENGVKVDVGEFWKALGE